MSTGQNTADRRVDLSGSTVWVVICLVALLGCVRQDVPEEMPRVAPPPPKREEVPRFRISRVEPILPAPEDIAAIMEPCPLPANSWPWWRGPEANGVSPDLHAPLRWSESDNVLWKSKVPGRGHSSPIIWGDKVFVTSADETVNTQTVLCYDRKTGGLVWCTPVHQDGFVRISSLNTHASATPACDGERVLATFLNRDALWVSALGMEGELLWQTEAGPFVSVHGGGPSPAVYGPYVFVNGDNKEYGFVAALSRMTGELVWRTDRATYHHGSYATPVVASLAGRPQLLLTGLGRTTGYDPATGRVLWSCRGPANQTANSVALADPYVFACGGDPQRVFLCVRADGDGDVTDTHVLWQTEKEVPNISSPLFYNGRIYAITDYGVASCLDAMAGDVLWQKRLRGPFFASPVASGGHVYVAAKSGTTFVFKDAPQRTLVAENKLDGSIYASPAICQGQLFIRSDEALYCIGN